MPKIDPIVALRDLIFILYMLRIRDKKADANSVSRYIYRRVYGYHTVGDKGEQL